VRSRLTRFGIGATSSARHPLTKARPPRWLMIIQLFAYAKWTTAGILAFLLGLARRRLRFVGTTDRRGVRQELVGMRKMMRLDRSSARRALFAVPLWACAAVPAFAEQQEATIVLGAGQKTCGEYLAVVYGLVPGRFRIETTPTGKTYGNDARALYEWLAGYISAANATSSDGVQIKTNPAAIDVWMRKHCEQNRTGSISHAAQQFVQELRVK
jgi:hypothetical protein